MEIRITNVWVVQNKKTVAQKKTLEKGPSACNDDLARGNSKSIDMNDQESPVYRMFQGTAFSKTSLRIITTAAST